MEFACFDLTDIGNFIGTCTLPHRQYDPVGTEHAFGDTAYVLVSTTIDGAGGRMYFRRKKVEDHG